jgi:hypothetical protein
MSKLKLIGLLTGVGNLKCQECVRGPSADISSSRVGAMNIFSTEDLRINTACSIHGAWRGRREHWEWFV